jgi:hypothetical protein
MPNTAEIHVKGAKELNRAFKQLRKEVLAELKPELVRIGEVVRADAQQRAFSEITNIGEQWGRMRLGVTVKGVYIAPKTRGHGSRRPNMSGLLMDRALQPALEAHEDQIVREFEALVTVAAAKARLF